MTPNQLYYWETLPVHPQPEPLESLTSYLTRLAEANSLQSMWHLFTLCFPSERPKLTFRTGDLPPVSFGALPALGACPEARLLATTFYHLAKKFDRDHRPQSLALFLPGSITQHSLRYCPHCLAERGYYRLTWRFLALEGCAEHGCRFLDRCDRCGQAIPLLPVCPKLGVCPTCGTDLRTCSADLLPASRRQVVDTRVRDFAYLVSPQACELSGDPITSKIGQQFAKWRQVRQLKVTDAARYLEQAPVTISGIEHGSEHSRVKFQWYVEYADFLQLSLQDIFESPAPDPPPQTYEEKLLTKIQQAMTALEQPGQPVTQEAVARMICTDVNNFTKYPRIRAMWAEYKTRWRQQREEELVHQVQQAIDTLKQQGQRVGQKAVCQMVGFTWQGLKQHHPAAWAVLEQQSDYPSPAQPTEPRHHLRTVYQRQDELVHQVQQAIERLKQQGQPLSQRAIAEVVGITPTGLRYYPRVKAIFQAHQAKRGPRDEDDLIAKVQAALLSLEETDTPVTRKAVGALLGLSPHTLMYYPRVKAFMAEQIPPKYEAYLARQRQQHEAELVLKVQQALETLTARGKPVTQAAIGKIVALSPVQLKRYPRVKALLAHYGLLKPGQ